jgi:RNA polymerase sigma factor (sigma-70 family)
MAKSDQVIAAAKGDQEAFQRLFDAYYAAIFATALVRLRNVADAEDAAQDTFLYAWRKLARLRDPARFPAWLRKIAIGRCGRILRRPRLIDNADEQVALVEDAQPSPLVVAETREAADIASKALARLPRAQREAVAYIATGLTYKDIAALLDVPLGTVKRRVHDSRRVLERTLYGLAGNAIRQRARIAQARLERRLRIREEAGKMNALLLAIGSATRDAVNEMYRVCDHIDISDGKINGEAVGPEVYAAVLERIKFNANLSGSSFKPGARPQVLLTCDGKRRDFDVLVGRQDGIQLTLRT